MPLIAPYLLLVKRAEQLFLLFASVFLIISPFLNPYKDLVPHLRAYLCLDLVMHPCASRAAGNPRTHRHGRSDVQAMISALNAPVLFG